MIPMKTKEYKIIVNFLNQIYMELYYKYVDVYYF